MTDAEIEEYIAFVADHIKDFDEEEELIDVPFLILSVKSSK